jgi:uroporphyrin-III C-methyltransferase / precorrin-2 dehydrogenase / sirohydrochlorin ferrochelatase
MSLFPIFVKLRNRFVIVVGGGAVAEGKIPGLLTAGARVRVVAPKVTEQIAAWTEQQRIDWRVKLFEPSDLDGAFLAIAATSAAGVNEAVYREAESHGILCNAVDDIDHCHFYYGSVVQRGDLQIAISTNGRSPALAQRLRLELEKQFGVEYAAWLEQLGTSRDLLRASGGDPEASKAVLHHLASRPMFERFLEQTRTHESKANRPAMGTVYLVGAGPGDPELLTVKATRLLQQADIVFHDSLVSREVLQLIGAKAEVIDIGKRCGQKLLTQEEINALLVSAAASHKTVVRLKGGDPLLFGRAGEELQALRDAKIAYEIVPGITAAFGAAAAAGISLTDRRLASQVVFSTFSRGTSEGAFDWASITPATTLLLYMPHQAYAEVAARLREGGLPGDLPCVIVSNATTSKQQTRWTNIAALANQEKLPAPALLIIGRVAAREVDQISATFWRNSEAESDTQQASVS